MPKDTALVDPDFREIHTVRLILNQITDKWSVMILTLLCQESLRFNELKRQLDGITHKSLTEALRRLERNGMITREVLSISPVAVRYSLASLGRSLELPFTALYEWAYQHASLVMKSQENYDKSIG